ncbi:MAG TPA: DUF1697 domain-containing protein [Mesorhizobium sp.]|nr:DUF1697 domain-containing protein [Mesorhizobium sp.]
MTAYVILFRGVGGATQLPVKPLKAALEAAGFSQVATYINSGNAVLCSDLPCEEVVSRVAASCAETFGFGKAVFALTAAEWAGLIARNPFPDAADVGKLLHAAVLANEPEPVKAEALEALAEAGGDRFTVVGRVAYLHTPRGFSQSKLAEKFDKAIGVPNTARNWNTVLKLRQLVERAGEEQTGR